MTIVEQFAASSLYVITCPPPEGPAGYAAMVEAACAGGAGVIQFRDKDLSWKRRYEVAGSLRKLCRARGVLFIVNDATDLALAIQADGVHLGQEDLPVAAARELARRSGRNEFLIGKSTHSFEQARQAEREEADYIGIGPVFSTPTKPAVMPVGLELVRRVSREISTPHVAIGGIDSTNVPQVVAAGARRAAVVRAVCGKRDVEEAARHLKTILESALKANG